MLFWMMNLMAVAATGLYLLVMWVGYASVRKLSNPRPLLAEVSEPQWLNDEHGVSDWARDKGYRLDCQFEFDGLVGTQLRIHTNAWYSPADKTFLMHYWVKQKHWLEFVSGVGGKYILATSNTRDSLFLPAFPQLLVQVFDGLDIAALRERHLQTLTYIEQRFGASPDEPRGSLAEHVIEVTEKQTAFVRSIPFWVLRVPWWYVFNRSWHVNRSLIDRIKKLG